MGSGWGAEAASALPPHSFAALATGMGALCASVSPYRLSAAPLQPALF